MKVLVTGAQGMLGRDLCPILEDAGCFVVETDIHNLDITDAAAVNSLVAKVRPDLVIHAAAYTNVDDAEKERGKAFLVNETGTVNIAKACSETGAANIYISTDYVFDGKKEGMYSSEDKPNPINIYGESKLAGECAVKKLCKKHYIIRTSWLYGQYGKNFVDTMLSLKDEAEIKVVEDQTSCPTWTVELSDGIIKTLKKPYGIYHICGSGRVNRYEFAREIFRLSNIDINIVPYKSEEFPQSAKRPKNSAMENNGMCKMWQEGLREYLAIKNSHIN